MARKKKHEEHANHEAWAIPYGDLVTLLFALFTVMYAMSSVNEGKFRVLSDSLIAAFHGAPKSLQPVNIGEKEPGKGGEKPLSGVMPTVLIKIREQGTPGEGRSPRDPDVLRAARSAGLARRAHPHGARGAERDAGVDRRQARDGPAREPVARDRDQHRHSVRERSCRISRRPPQRCSTSSPTCSSRFRIRSASRVIPTIGRSRPAPIPSNWELSAARAASVVHEFTKVGIDPLRLEIVGFGEFHPRQANDTVEGRNANRRVAILVLEAVAPGDPVIATDPHVDCAGCRTGHRRGGCVGCGKSATMARAARGSWQDRAGQGSCRAARRRQTAACRTAANATHRRRSGGRTSPSPAPSQ